MPDALYAAVRPNLDVELAELALFKEAIAQLERPLSRANIRTLALEPGGPVTLSVIARGSTRRRTRPWSMPSIRPSCRARCAASAGRPCWLRGASRTTCLLFRPSSGAEQSLKVIDLIDAANDADVNLVILQAPAAAPAGRAATGSGSASPSAVSTTHLKRATFGDFLDALAANRGEFRVAVTRDGGGRVVMRAVPDASGAEPLTGLLGDWLSNAASSVTGNVVTSAVEVHARDEARQAELDRRFVPIHSRRASRSPISSASSPGLLGWQVASDVVAAHLAARRSAASIRAWPASAQRRARACSRSCLLFLPIVGVPALLVSTRAAVVWRRFCCRFALRRLARGRASAKAG